MLSMKRLVFILLLLLTCIYGFGYDITGRVVSVKDGDTIEILYQSKAYRIRLNGVDCPEKAQAYGYKAKQYTSDLCFGKTVTAQISDTDKYGRYIADIVLPDGRILNQELIRSGFAWHYKQYSTDKRLADLEVQAKKNRIGLWSDSNPIAPWNYRHGSSSNQIPTDKKGYLVGSKNSNKYHLATCQWAKRIKQANILYFKTKAEAEKAGYQPCKVCHP